MQTRSAYYEFIEKCIGEISYPKSPDGLYAPIAYTLQCGGKRIRPILLMAATDAFGADYKLAVNQALGIEMFHNFTLLHDDLMDNADLRRGYPTVHKKWSEETAVLSGDAMLTMATQLISKCSNSILRMVLDHYNKTAMEIYEGQQLDMDFENRTDVSLEEYMEMIRLKTSVLLGAACYIGALVALDSNGSMSEDNVNRANALREYGVLLGLAFQLRDDYLDTYGDPHTFGKEIGGDIVNNKKTWLLTSAIAQDKHDVFKGMISDRELSDNPECKIEKFKQQYELLGIPGQCVRQINSYVEQAIDKLTMAKLDHEAYTFFQELALSSAARIS